MKILNPDGMMIEMLEKGEITKLVDSSEFSEKFNERIKFLIENYQNLEKTKNLSPIYTELVEKDKKKDQISWIMQVILLCKRGFISEFRNPMDLLLKIINSFIFGLAILLIFINVIIYLI